MIRIPTLLIIIIVSVSGTEVGLHGSVKIIANLKVIVLIILIVSLIVIVIIIVHTDLIIRIDHHTYL